MERHYTRNVLKKALDGAPYKVSEGGLTDAVKAGKATERKFFPPFGKYICGMTVYDVQTWLARRNEYLPEWILRKILDQAALEVIAYGGLPAKMQLYLDKETGYES